MSLKKKIGGGHIMSEKNPSDTKFVDEEKLALYGIGVSAGKQLEMRLIWQQKFSEAINKELTGDTPEEKIKNLIKKVRETDTMVQTALTWLAAGSNRDMSIPIRGYTSQAALMETCLLYMLNDCEGRSPVEQQGIALTQEIFVNRHYFKWCKYLLAHTFKEIQLNPTYDRTHVIKTQPAGRGIGIDPNKEADNL